MKLHKALQQELRFKGCLFGVEIEVEGVHLPDRNKLPPEWQAVDDGSLRGESAEYIFKIPYSPLKTKTAIKRLALAFEEANTALAFSCRTSVHVHMNVGDLELQEIANIIYLYYLFEDVLLQYCGQDRYENRFCLSVRAAEQIIPLIKAGLNPGGLYIFNENTYKYAALNLACMNDKNSIEFRSMRGTMDTKVLFPWLDVLANLYSIALSYKNPKEIQSDYFKNGYEELAKKVFENHYELFACPNMAEAIAYNASICAELPEIDVNRGAERDGVKKKLQPIEGINFVNLNAYPLAPMALQNPYVADEDEEEPAEQEEEDNDPDEEE